MDFTLTTYQKLLQSLLDHGFTFRPFAEHLEPLEAKAVILRHDVDKLPENSLQTAQLEHSLGIRGSYYFRVVKGSWNEGIMRQIAGMGHEIGYHYEDLSLCRGDHGEAIRHFEKQLERFREIAEVKTICMHGSPMSRYDNRDLWQSPPASGSPDSGAQTQAVHYRNYGIIGEPYFDIDYSKVLYLTDTGRRWNGDSVSVRDKVGSFGPGGESAFGASGSGSANPARGKANEHAGRLRFRHTRDIIRAAEQGLLPDQLMITIHPQRWTNKPLPWAKELVWQNVKNVAKRILVHARK